MKGKGKKGIDWKEVKVTRKDMTLFVENLKRFKKSCQTNLARSQDIKSIDKNQYFNILAFS